MTSPRPTKTSAILANGSPRWVAEGAVRQDGSLKLMGCNTCGAEVVWATSARTGRKFLVNVTKGADDRRFYMKRNVHRCPGAAAVKDRNQAITDTCNAEAAWEAARDAFIDDPENPEVEAAMDAARAAFKAAKAAEAAAWSS